MKKIACLLLVVLLTAGAVFAKGTTESTQNATINQNITMYVTVKAGGALDVRARIIADYLSKELGVNVSVANIPGAGGLTCATQMLTNPSGPYDLMFTAASTFTAGPVFESSCIYTIDDFKVLAPIDVEEFGLYTAPSRTGFKTFEDVIQFGTNKELIFGCGGIANITYLYQAALYKALGISYNTLIHNGGIEGITNCMGGHNMITMCGLETARPYVENGDIVPVLTFCDVDYTGYQGYSVPSVLKYVNNTENVYRSLMEVVCLSKVDDAHYAILKAAIDRCLANSDCVAELKKVGLNYIPEMTAEETTQHIKDEYDTLQKFVQQLVK